MKTKEENLREAKIFFESLKTDKKSQVFPEEKLNLKLFKKLHM